MVELKQAIDMFTELEMSGWVKKVGELKAKTKVKKNNRPMFGML